MEDQENLAIISPPKKSLNRVILPITTGITVTVVGAISQVPLPQASVMGMLGATGAGVVTVIEEPERRKQKIKETISALEARQEAIQQDIAALESKQSEYRRIAGELEISKSKYDTLQKEIKTLEEKTSHLQGQEAILSQREAEIQDLSEKIEKEQNTLKELNQKAVELEFLRSTYDALESEKQAYESRRENLQAEVFNLEAEKDRIWQSIQELQNDAQQSTDLRQKIANLKAKIRQSNNQLEDIQSDIEQLEIVKKNLDNEIHNQEKILDRKQKEVKALEEKISELNQEIETIENSAKLALQTLEKPITGLIDQGLTAWEEDDFLNKFIHFLDQHHLDFHERIVKAFHTSLKVQDISALVILAGISGTGKSELPQKYANFIGAPLVMLPVQPRWDSPQDLQGFYNYIEKKYKPTELMHYLYQYQKDPAMKGRIVLVLLDEMNLARVEYYFSDFLSKLETKHSQNTYLSLDVGSLILPENQRNILIPKEFLFIGTMNEDETTQSLSDKVLDRANVLTFGRPNELKLRGQQTKHEPQSHYLPWTVFDNWTKDPDPNSMIIQKVKDYVDQANEIMDKLGHPFAHRVYQAIAKYVVNYPGVEQDTTTLNQAIADQFGQKILPKLRGIRIEEASAELEEMRKLIEQLGDQALITAFDRAKNGPHGQFQWKGMVYT